MAANFESGFFYDKPAWHGEGIVLQSVANAQEALQAGGLDWNVFKEKMYLHDGATEIPRHYAVMRDMDSSILGVVGEKYTTLQNKDAFSFFDNIVESEEAIYHTAGSLQGGRKVWILAKLPGNIEVHGDPIEKYVLISNSHDGSTSIVAGITPVRVVCENTLNWAMRDLQNRIKVRHTKNAKLALAEAHRIMGIANRNFVNLESIFGDIANKDFNSEGFDNYLDKVFPTTAEHTTRIDNIKNNVKNLFEGDAKGSDQRGFRGTAWGAYNSVVEYIDFRRKSKDRLNAVWFTSGVAIKERAFKEAVLM